MDEQRLDAIGPPHPQPAFWGADYIRAAAIGVSARERSRRVRTCVPVSNGG
jgi:hypothetical protein